MKLGILLLSLIPLLGFAGERGGNGGGVHACPGKVELYDFYEGRSPLMHDLPVWQPSPGLTREDYLRLAIDKLKQAERNLGEYAQIKLNELLAIPYDQLVLPVRLPPSNDADIFMVEEGCEYRQVATWNERFNRVVFSRALFERMSPMDQAGLFIHEILYKGSRDTRRPGGVDAVRKAVATLFSDRPFGFEWITGPDSIFGLAVLMPRNETVCTLMLELNASHPQQSAISTRIDQVVSQGPYHAGIMSLVGRTLPASVTLPCSQVPEALERACFYFSTQWTRAVGTYSFRITLNGESLMGLMPSRQLNDTPVDARGIVRSGRTVVPNILFVK